MTHPPTDRQSIPATPRKHNPVLLADMREFAMAALGDLWAQLDAGTVEFLDSHTLPEEDGDGKTTGVVTLAVTYRKPRKPAGKRDIPSDILGNA